LPMTCSAAVPADGKVHIASRIHPHPMGGIGIRA
jgi:hypothetical protein